MIRIFNILFPVFDYLYIFQVMEYNWMEFLKWWIKNFTRRNLAVKQRLVFTPKIMFLALISSGLILLRATIANYQFLGNFNILFFLLLIIVIAQFSPLVIVFGQLLLYPMEVYQKNKIVNSAKQKLEKLPDLKVVAITGSFGKTSTKDILYTLLWKKFRVVKTPKSYNNPLSIAQTILEDVKDDTQVFIAEVGAYKRGEIKNVAKIIQPDIALITAVAPQHLEKFGSLENIAKAKLEIIESLKESGLAILNGNSSLLKQYYDTLVNQSEFKIVFFGEGEQYFITDIEVKLSDTSFILHTQKGNVKIRIPLIGEHHAKNFLPAAIVALNLGVSFDEIAKRAEKLLSTPHRLEIKKQNGLTIIDNSYNTNPESARISFKLLADYPGAGKIIITPGLIELGKKAETENENFAKEAAKFADKIIIVGENAKKYLLAGLSDAKFSSGKIHTVKNLKEAMHLLTQIAKPNDVILIENDLPDNYF